MASHVVVIDSTARRAQIKTNPNKPLSDVLEEACGKLGLDASKYGLKNNNKQIDLSRTFRLSGLSSGAKLELVQLSKSAGVVSVALQLPEAEAQGAPNARLTDKFPSTTTLWLVLRKFEAGVAGSVSINRNLTARGAPAIDSGNSGAGRLYYQQPVLQTMNRELASFTDLQKTLSQLGLNSGSALMRLSFRTTQTPLEEAMTQIQQYFDSVGATSVVSSHAADALSVFPSVTEPAIPMPVESEHALPAEPIPQVAQPETEPAGNEPTETSLPLETTTNRPISVFRPPSSSTPSAALSKHNDSDYIPTVEHAQTHQRMLSQSSKNVRLPTEAELATQAEAEQQKLAAIKDVEIKIRFPDQSAVSAKFGQTDSGAELYTFVRDCLMNDLRQEPFVLRNPGIRGKGVVIPDNSTNRLIRDLLLKGRVLVVFDWDDTKASPKTRGTKTVLRSELQARATEYKVQDITSIEEDKDDPGTKVNIGKKEQGSTEDGDGKKKGMPKWLKGLSKK